MREFRGGTRLGRRVIAFVLTVGGVLGMLQSAFTLRTAPIHGAMGIALYALSSGAGVALWRGHPRALPFARAMLALQVPVFSIGRVAYAFSTLLSVRVLIGQTDRHWGGDLGSSATFYLAPLPLRFLLGVNVVALAALLYLLGAGSSADPQSEVRGA